MGKGGGLIKILHTADWHIGHELAGWAREAEQARVLEEIAELVIAHGVDALVVAGDIFDHQNPSSTMYKMLYEFFDRLAIRVPGLISVIVAGNHDSAGRLEAPGALLKRANVEAIGSLHLINGQPDLSRHLIEVKRQGEIVGYILAIPYLRPADLPFIDKPEQSRNSSSLVEAIKQLYQGVIKECRARIGDKPLVVTGHLHVKGAALSESMSERRIVIGGEHAVPAQLFGVDADYIALGHLHRAQNLGAERQAKGRTKRHNKTLIRYAGSPLPLSVVERTYDHGVSLVTIDKSSLDLHHIKLKRSVPFLRVPETGRLNLDQVSDALAALQLDPNLPQEQWPFVQIALQIDGPQPGFRSQLDDIFTGFPLRDVAPDISWPGQVSRPTKPSQTQRLGEMRPVDLFAEAFIERYGVEPDEQHLDCFRQLVDEAGT